MALLIHIPKINPLHFTQKNYAAPAQYNFKHPDIFQFEDTIRTWEQNVGWYQPWQLNDSIKLQLHSQIAPVEVKIYDQHGYMIYQVAMQQGLQSFFDPTLFIYELDLSLNIFDEGFYQMEIEFGSPVLNTIVSNIFQIRESYFEDTILCEFFHRKHYADAYFEAGWTSSIRMFGTLDYEKPGSKNTVYEDQEYDTTLLDTKPFDTWRLYTGGPEGIPHWAIMKYNIIMGCSSLKLDGKYFTKATDGVNFEQRDEKEYPMRGWSIELRDKLNRRSQILTGDGAQNTLGLTVSINVESKGFVADDLGGSYYEVEDIE